MRRFSSRRSPHKSQITRVNNKIRARKVRVIGLDGSQLGVYGLSEALTMARNNGVDLVEVAASADPPVCRLINFGKYRYEQAKKEKESKKHQHGNKLKEVQLSPVIDPHDFEVKIGHAVDFLCEEMKVKAVLRFKGRQMAHKEVGQKVVQRFIEELRPYGQPDAPPRMVGRTINVVISPLPRQKRAPNPHAHAQREGGEGGEESEEEASHAASQPDAENSHSSQSDTRRQKKGDKGRIPIEGGDEELQQNPFENLNGEPPEETEAPSTSE